MRDGAGRPAPRARPVTRRRAVPRSAGRVGAAPPRPVRPRRLSPPAPPGMGSTCRIAPPLTATREELALGLEILDQAIGEATPA
ncbi:hypothetical protein D2L64_15005 [Micromonospora radicis]|uniref:Aminotransferase class III-fold pyridoxal phosphate-dependent enzyme n=1 Tax=Micromonospora radicis TaxID=1894971 RepID=A0A418MTH3_9ACTN|nr:hypothetical protein D2L64_15005 [Micromonospora radicis]